MRLLSALLLIISSLSLNNQANDEWLGKKINIPDGKVVCKVLGRDASCVDLWTNSYKVFTYVDSIGCSSCQMEMWLWKPYIDACKQQNFDVSFIFVVHSSDYERFDSDVLMYEFDFPIFYDYENRFGRANNFMSSFNRTFLLDKDNRVLLTGSPINNSKLWEQYIEKITHQQATDCP